MQAELSGFATVVLAKVELLVGQNATIPFTLKLAQVSETLTVLGESPLVDTSSSQVAGNVDRRQMEELPLQGRNWMELSKLVKGITANDVGNTPGVSRDDDFQLNLDGQQITQKIAGSGFGQPKFSREAIAEFQIVTNMFDITQGRSAGIQVQAISRSGTNNMSGSVYGFFRDDKFNAADPSPTGCCRIRTSRSAARSAGRSSRTRCTSSRRTNTSASRARSSSSNSALPGQSFTRPVQEQAEEPAGPRRRSADAERPADDPRIALGSGQPVRARSRRPSLERVRADQERDEHRRHLVEGAERQQGAGSARSATTTSTGRDTPQPRVRAPSSTTFRGLTIGKPYNYPQLFHQNNFESRYDLSWHKNTHDIKIGGEFIYVHEHRRLVHPAGRPHDLQLESGQHELDHRRRRPVDLEYRGDSQLDRARVRPELPPQRLGHQRAAPDVGVVVRRQLARRRSQLTVNYGVRWDVDWGVASPPDVITNSIPINNNAAASRKDLPG